MIESQLLYVLQSGYTFNNNGWRRTRSQALLRIWGIKASIGGLHWV
ncbi:hypothetical protein ACU8KH_03155 [Lachancea thermotolerans]